LRSQIEKWSWFDIGTHKNINKINRTTHTMFHSYWGNRKYLTIEYHFCLWICVWLCTAACICSANTQILYSQRYEKNKNDERQDIDSYIVGDFPRYILKECSVQFLLFLWWYTFRANLMSDFVHSWIMDDDEWKMNRLLYLYILYSLILGTSLCTIWRRWKIEKEIEI
jgi:hypothetical protein